MVLGKQYVGPEVDVWSLGVILFALLSGHLPFRDNVSSELYRKIANAIYTMPDSFSPGTLPFEFIFKFKSNMTITRRARYCPENADSGS